MVMRLALNHWVIYLSTHRSPLPKKASCTFFRKCTIVKAFLSRKFVN
ncbi:Uncharacterised protein [Vibrio cholerae]|nr:Uncharacterised protein [Vibrio cholerae]